MQWGAAEHGGFTTGTPWLPLAADFEAHNAAALATDAFSILSLYVGLIELRKKTPELVFGDYETVDAPGNLLAYRRVYDGQGLLVALNLGSEPVIMDAESNAGQAYDDAVARLLGEQRPMRFTHLEKKGFFSKLFGG
jgi:alpha-glucosidase